VYDFAALSLRGIDKPGRINFDRGTYANVNGTLLPVEAALPGLGRAEHRLVRNVIAAAVSGAAGAVVGAGGAAGDASGSGQQLQGQGQGGQSGRGSGCQQKHHQGGAGGFKVRVCVQCEGVRARMCACVCTHEARGSARVWVAAMALTKCAPDATPCPHMRTGARRLAQHV
jgi:hypothetical protein